jgi:hypothetical protein
MEMEMGWEWKWKWEWEWKIEIGVRVRVWPWVAVGSLVFRLCGAESSLRLSESSATMDCLFEFWVKCRSLLDILKYMQYLDGLLIVV